MRKLVYVLVAILLLGSLEAASACSWVGPTPTDADLFAKASTVFVGRIVRTDEIESYQYPGAGTGPAVEGTFRLLEVLKGEPPADRKIVGPIFVMCMMPLMAGLDYLIFLNEGSSFIVWVADKGTRLFPYEPPANAGSPPPRADPHCVLRECVLGRLRELSKIAGEGRRVQ